MTDWMDCRKPMATSSTFSVMAARPDNSASSTSTPNVDRTLKGCREKGLTSIPRSFPAGKSLRVGYPSMWFPEQICL